MVLGGFRSFHVLVTTHISFTHHSDTVRARIKKAGIILYETTMTGNQNVNKKKFNERCTAPTLFIKDSK